MRVLPHGAIVMGFEGSEEAFSQALDEVNKHKFTGYLELRMKVRGGELWGVVVFNGGNLVESYASRLGTDIFGEMAYVYLMDLATDPNTKIVLHELDSNNIMDFIMDGRSKTIKIEDDSWRPEIKSIPGFDTPQVIGAQGPDVGEVPDGSMIKKVVLLGDPSVGKTSTMRRFVENTFDEAYLSTIGSNVNKKTINLVSDNGNSRAITLMIWDIAGDKACDSLKNAYFRGAHGAIVVCDITLESSYKSLSTWIDTLRSIVGEVPVVIIGNKADLDDLRVIDRADLHDMATKYNAQAFETSARTGENVEMIFHSVTDMIVGN